MADLSKIDRELRRIFNTYSFMVTRQKKHEHRIRIEGWAGNRLYTEEFRVHHMGNHWVMISKALKSIKKRIRENL